jgi:hypothetical protein
VAAACLARLFVRPSTTCGLVKFWRRADARIFIDKAHHEWHVLARPQEYGSVHDAPFREVLFTGSVVGVPILFAAISVGDTAWVKEMISCSREFEKFEWRLGTGGKKVCALDVANATGDKAMIRLVKYTRFAGLGNTVIK